MKKLFCILEIVILFSCEKNEKITIIDSDEIFTKGIFTNIYITDNNNIYGYNDDYFITSTDGLKSIKYYDKPYGRQIIYFDSSNILLYYKVGTDFNGFFIEQSSDFAESFYKTINIPIKYLHFNHYPRMINKDYGIYLSTAYDESYSSNVLTKVYRIYKSDTLLLSSFYGKTGYNHVVFLDSLNVLIIANPYFVRRSSDGGITWNDKDSIMNLNPLIPQEYVFPSLVTLPNGIIACYKWYYNKRNGDMEYVNILKEFRYSNDYFKNWNNITFPPNGDIIDISFLSTQTIRVLVKKLDDEIFNMYADIYETKDFGVNWIKISEDSIIADKFYFTNESKGIAFGKIAGTIYITNDGGTSWNLLAQNQCCE